MLTQQEREITVACPICGRDLRGHDDPPGAALTHHKCQCGFKLGIKRDANGTIVAAWRE